VISIQKVLRQVQGRKLKQYVNSIWSSPRSDDVGPKLDRKRLVVAFPTKVVGHVGNKRGWLLMAGAITGRHPSRTSCVGKGQFIAGPVDVVWLSQARKFGVTAEILRKFLSQSCSALPNGILASTRFLA
jgi:hypothetical protein